MQISTIINTTMSLQMPFGRFMSKVCRTFTGNVILRFDKTFILYFSENYLRVNIEKNCQILYNCYYDDTMHALQLAKQIKNNGMCLVNTCRSKTRGYTFNPRVFNLFSMLCLLLYINMEHENVRYDNMKTYDISYE